MATLTVKFRRPLQTSCKDCGQPGLQWVATGQDNSKKTAVNPDGWVGYHYVPFQTDDFSGKVHPITPCGGESAYAKKGTALDIDLPNNAEAPAPEPVRKPVRKPLTNAEQAAPIDLKPLEARIDSAEQTIAQMQPGINKLTDVINDTSKKMDTKLSEMKDTIARQNAAREITIVGPSLPKPINLGRQHRMLPNAIAILNAIGDSGVLYLVGEGGSGKSSIAGLLSQGLGLKQPWGAFTCHAYTTGIDILGYHDANGHYVETEYYRRYTQGGLMFIDELNRASAESAAVINGLTSSDKTGFPNGLQTRHKEHYAAAAGNTYGRGPDAEYIGTMQMDAATLSRMVYLPWNTDWELLGDAFNLKITGDAPLFLDPGSPRSDTDPLVKGWGQLVKSVRDQAQKDGVRASIGARALINGYKMLRAGIAYDLVQFSTLWAHMDTDSAAQIKANLGLK